MDDNKNILISRYLSKEASADEVRELEMWVLESPQNMEEFQRLRNLWEVSNPAGRPSEEDCGKAFDRLESALFAPRRKFFPFIQKAAAVLLLPFVLLSLYLFLQIQKNNSREDLIEVRALYGTVSELKLPDGSKVWLNGGSRFEYPAVFKKDKRQVKLDGEAYFEVQADTKKPFKVCAEDMTVTATGTAFNVEAYSADSLSAVTLVNGKVSVGFPDNSQYALNAGERISFIVGADSVRKSEAADVYKWYAWKDGILLFRDDPLSFVFKRLETSFNVKFIIKDSDLASAPYRAKFNNESLEEILTLLELSAPIEFRKTKRVRGSDNGFEKEEIEVLYKR